MAIKVLVVDDDQDILDLMEYNLKKYGFSVNTAADGKKAVKKAFEINPEVIILDVMMPEMDGVEVCGRLREESNFKNTIIIFSSARSEDFTQLSAYESGADDYIIKPIKPKILISRIKVLLKRSIRADDYVKQIELGDLIINKEKVSVSYKNEPINLVRKEFELLFLLASQPGKVFSRDEIIESVWDNDVIVGNRTIDVHIRRLREKVGIEYFETVKGIGYRFKEIN